MKNKYIYLSLFLTLIFNSSFSEASDYFYNINLGASVSMSGDNDFGNERFSTSPLMELKLGKEFGSDFSAALSFAYRNDFKWSQSNYIGSQTQDPTALTIMAEGMYKFSRYEKYVPYVLVGAGLSRVDNGSYIISNAKPIEQKAKNYFSWQAGFGALIDLEKDIKLNLCYKFIDLGKVEQVIYPSAKKSISKLRSNEFTIGIHIPVVLNM